jgi:hypothetical protein
MRSSKMMVMMRRMFFWVKSLCGLFGRSQRLEKLPFSIFRAEVVSRANQNTQPAAEDVFIQLLHVQTTAA